MRTPAHTTWKSLGVASACLVIGVVPFLVVGSDARYVLKVLSFVGINVIIVTGLALLFGHAGQVSLGHAGFFGLGAYTSAYLTTALGLPWLVGLAGAVAVTALGGVTLALPSLRLKGHYLAMATLGFGEIMRVGFVEVRAITGGPDGLSGIPYASIGALRFDTPQLNYWLVWAAAGVVLWVSANIVRGRPGRSMLALHGSELGAMASGVSVVGLKVRVFTISAVFAGVAGSLYAHAVGFVSPSTFTLHLSVVLLAMAVLGGTRSLLGPAAAAALLSLIPYADAVLPGLSRGALAVMQEWEADVYGLIIIVVMLFLPDGVSGVLRKMRSGRGERA
ncbi:MAG: branched-chain amino acid ABC transporter permease [Actinomycetota bacterium]|nr:branched-chain amino acid ABC transporter permease [Actinomycetota bacterium]